MPQQSKRRIALLVLGCALLLRISPMSVYNATVLLLGNTCGWVWQTARAVPTGPPPLKAAILNVTADFDQLAHLLGDWFEQPGMDPGIEQSFKAFLQTRAARAHPRLESLLDWLLAVYKFLFPFLLISLAARRSGGSKEAPPEAELDSCAADGPHDGLGYQPSLPHVATLSRRSSQQQKDGGVPVHAASGHAASASLNGFSSFAPRPGSQSPAGPETPVDGGLARMPLHPATRLAGKQRQRLATANESETEFTF